MSIHVGIGSWADDEYVGVLYPEGTSAKKRLNAYAERFNHVEVNSTYYRTPGAKGVAAWVEQTPERFTFTIKLHRAFSQDLENASQGPLVDRLLAGVEPLVHAQKLAAFLLVLPYAFGPKKHRLEELDTVATKLAPHPLAVELRHRDWLSDERADATLRHFRDRGMVLVLTDMPDLGLPSIMPRTNEVTRPSLAYLRLHGRNPRWREARTADERHDHEYAGHELEEIAERVRLLAERAEHVHVIANNHIHDYAPKAALALQERLGLARS